MKCIDLDVNSPEPTKINTSNGGAEEDRTPDLLRARQALSQLSYGPRVFRRSETPAVCSRKLMQTTVPFRVTWWVWVDLNHRPHPYQGCALTN